VSGSPAVLPSDPCARMMTRNQNEKGFGTTTKRDLEQADCLAAGKAVVVASAPAAALEENAPFEAG
jgi:hypothetical protein